MGQITKGGTYLLDSELHWLAGLLEGEGYFAQARYKRGGKWVCRPRVRLAMVDRDVVERAAALMGRPARFSHPPSHRKRNDQPQWIVDLLGPIALQLMKELLPLLGERRARRVRDVIAASE